MLLDARGWKLCALRDCADARVSSANDRTRARTWLRSFKVDPQKMSGLRALLNRELRRDISRMSDDDVVDAVAALLSDNRLHVHAPVMKAVVTVAAQPKESAPAFQRSSPPPRTPSPRLPTIDPPTFESSDDLVLQAATLVAAAAEGAPFCAICAARAALGPQ